MNRKQLIGLLVLLVVVGGAGLLLRHREDTAGASGNQTLGKKLMGNFPVNDVSTVFIQEGTNTVTLTKKDDLWRVQERGGYPANYSTISDFLLKLRDLKIVQTEQIGPSQLPRLSLAPGQSSNAPTQVDFKDASGKPMKTLLLGKKHFKKSGRASQFGDMGDEGWPDGRYVNVGRDAPNVSVISDALANIEPKPDQWLNKDFFKVEKVRSVAVTLPNATNSWKLSRETESGEWKLADAKPGEALDQTKASGVVNPLNSPSFNDVVPGITPDQFRPDKPSIVNVDTFDGFNYVLKLSEKTNENYTLAMGITAQLAKERTPGKDEKPEDKDKLDKEFKEKQGKLEEKLAQEKNCEKWVYVVAGWSFDSLLKDRSQLLLEKKEEPKKDDAAAAKDTTSDASPDANATAVKDAPVAKDAPAPKDSTAAKDATASKDANGAKDAPSSPVVEAKPEQK